MVLLFFNVIDFRMMKNVRDSFDDSDKDRSKVQVQINGSFHSFWIKTNQVSNFDHLMCKNLGTGISHMSAGKDMALISNCLKIKSCDFLPV